MLRPFSFENMYEGRWNKQRPQNIKRLQQPKTSKI